LASGGASLVRFRGAVSCRRAAHGPLGLTLTGTGADPPGEELSCAFAGLAPADLPAQLEDAVVTRAAPGEYVVASGARTWRLAARSLHVHREVAKEFYRAIPPRPAPLLRRALFGAMLTLARSRAGIALLRALRAR
jgi:hypothetical protein